MNPIRIVQLGLGPIGQACVRELSRRSTIELVGGVDVDPAKVGRDLGEVCGLETPLGTTVRADLAAALAEWRPQAVVHTTQSFLDRIRGQLEPGPGGMEAHGQCVGARPGRGRPRADVPHPADRRAAGGPESLPR